MKNHTYVFQDPFGHGQIAVELWDDEEAVTPVTVMWRSMPGDMWGMKWDLKYEEGDDVQIAFEREETAAPETMREIGEHESSLDGMFVQVDDREAERFRWEHQAERD